jgi:hypothetical protein
VYDAVSYEDTQQQLGYDTLAEGGHIVIVLPPSIKETQGTRKKIVRVWGSVYVPENREIGKALVKHLPGLIEAGDIVVCVFVIIVIISSLFAFILPRCEPLIVTFLRRCSRIESRSYLAV